MTEIRDGVPLEKEEEIFSKLLQEKAFEFNNLNDKINSNELTYQFKTEGRSLKDSRDYQNPTELLKNLKDGNVNSKEVLKSEI